MECNIQFLAFIVIQKEFIFLNPSTVGVITAIPPFVFFVKGAVYGIALIAVVALNNLTNSGGHLSRITPAPIDTKNLRIHPPTVWSSKKRHDIRNILGLTKPLKRGKFRNLSNLLLAFAIKKEFCSNWSGAMALTVMFRPRSSLAST